MISIPNDSNDSNKPPNMGVSYALAATPCVIHRLGPWNHPQIFPSLEPSWASHRSPAYALEAFRSPPGRAAGIWWWDDILDDFVDMA